MNSGLPDRNGARRRRFWSSDEKRRMVAESFAPGAPQRYCVKYQSVVHLGGAGTREAQRAAA
jgi:transposase-like protein